LIFTRLVTVNFVSVVYQLAITSRRAIDLQGAIETTRMMSCPATARLVVSTSVFTQVTFSESFVVVCYIVIATS
jgi:hypothetical protein